MTTCVDGILHQKMTWRTTAWSVGQKTTTREDGINGTAKRPSHFFDSLSLLRQSESRCHTRRNPHRFGLISSKIPVIICLNHFFSYICGQITKNDEDEVQNGHIEKKPQDYFDYDNEDDFEDICDIYNDDIDLKYSNCRICRIPEEWKSE